MPTPVPLTDEEQRDFDALSLIESGPAVAGSEEDPCVTLGLATVHDGQVVLNEKGRARLVQLRAQIAEKQARADIVAARAAWNAAQARVAGASEGTRADVEAEVDHLGGEVARLQVELVARQRELRLAREALRELYGSVVVAVVAEIPEPEPKRDDVVNLVENNPWLRNPRR
jgi:hypothetical protein